MGRGGRGRPVGLIEVAERVVVDSRLYGLGRGDAQRGGHGPPLATLRGPLVADLPPPFLFDLRGGNGLARTMPGRAAPLARGESGRSEATSLPLPP